MNITKATTASSPVRWLHGKITQHQRLPKNNFLFSLFPIFLHLQLDYFSTTTKNLSHTSYVYTHREHNDLLNGSCRYFFFLRWNALFMVLDKFVHQFFFCFFVFLLLSRFVSFPHKTTISYWDCIFNRFNARSSFSISLSSWNEHVHNQPGISPWRT